MAKSLFGAPSIAELKRMSLGPPKRNSSSFVVVDDVVCFSAPSALQLPGQENTPSILQTKALIYSEQ